MKKKRIITATALLLVFIASLVGFSILLNRGTDDMTAGMGGAKLPSISFEESGYEVNLLPGYTEEMEIPNMRDTILPVSVGTSVTGNLSGYTGKIGEVSYEVYSLDGQKVLKSETFTDVKDVVKIELGDSISDGGEKVLKIRLLTEEGKAVYYYMRVVRAAEFNVQQCMEFAEKFHDMTFDPDKVSELATYLGTEGAGAGNGLQKVTLASGLDELGWGGHTPVVEGDVRWEIKESNETYTSLLLKYRVKCEEEAGTDLYNVTEFFKVRFLKGEATLESYERTMNEVFEGKETDFYKKGIVLGLAEEDVSYMTDEEEKYVAFVQEREVWLYGRKDNQIALLFSFSNAENQDVRNYNDNHMVRLLNVDDAGNTTFAVYGYMNRGVHEGQVGAAIYRYHTEEKVVQEKVFIPSKSSGEIAQRSLNQFIYYNESSNILYAMFEGTLYQVDLEGQKKKALVEGLETNQYKSSENGRYVAYQVVEEAVKTNVMEVWDLEKEVSFRVQAGADETILPIGFVMGDVVYGVRRNGDSAQTSLGEIINPFYKLEIQNSKNEVVKTYLVEGTYIADAYIESNMISLERVVKNGNIYESASPDYITNNEAEEEEKITVETVSSESKGASVRLAGISVEDRNPKILRPKQLLFERPTTIAFNQAEVNDSYYVYGLGRLQGIYERAGEAVKAADAIRGVVVTGRQEKLWERGNRMLQHSIAGANAFTANEGESSLAACLRQMFAMGGSQVDVTAELSGGKSVMDMIDAYSGGEAVELTGCTLEQLCYIIGKDTPVIAMTGGDSALLIVGYDGSLFTCLNPSSGTKTVVRMSELENMTAGGRNVFFGYVK